MPELLYVTQRDNWLGGLVKSRDFALVSLRAILSSVSSTAGLLRISSHILKVTKFN
jgi:hypothetical protein